jgi:hypothetical protein
MLKNAPPSKIIGKPNDAWKSWHNALELMFHGNEKEAQKIMNELFSDKVEMKPPTYYKTRKSKPFTLMALRGVSQLFKDFRYTREFIGERDFALEFVCKCGDNGPELQGVDLIKLDENGKIIEFAVVARPPKAVQVLLEHQSKFMEQFLKEAKL